MKARTCLVLLVMLSASPALAQDSTAGLEAQLAEAVGADRVPILIQLVEAGYLRNPEAAIIHAREVLGRLDERDRRSLRVMYLKGMAHLGTSPETASPIDSAWVVVRQLRESANAAEDLQGRADAHYLAARTHRATGALLESLAELRSAEPLYESAGDRQGLALTLRQMGSIVGNEFQMREDLQGRADFDSATRYLDRAVALAEGLDDRSIVASVLLSAAANERTKADVLLDWHFDEDGKFAGATPLVGDTGELSVSPMDPYAVAVRQYERAAELFKELKGYSGLYEAYSSLWTMSFNTVDYGGAVAYAKQLVDFLESEGVEDQNLLSALFIYSNISQERGNFDAALAGFRRTLQINEQRDDPAELAATLANIGSVLKQQGDYEQALSHYARARDIQEEIGIGQWTLSPIAEIHFEQGEYPEALDMYTRALREEEEYKASISDFDRMQHGPITLGPLLGLAHVHRALGHNEEALAYFNRAIDVMNVGLDRNEYAATLASIGALHAEAGDYAQALLFFDRSRALALQVNDRDGLAETFNNISAVYRQQGDLEQALAYADSSLALGVATGAQKSIRDAQEERTLILEQQGRFAEALNAHRAFKTANDSLFTAGGQTVLAELQQQYKTKEQEQQIKILESNAEIQRLWRIGLVGGLILICAIAFLIYNRYRLKNRAHVALTTAHNELQEANTLLQTTQRRMIQQEKMASLGTLTAGIAHEIKNPLNFVNNFAEVSEELAAEAKEALTKGDLAEVADLLSDVADNAALISQHGKRANGIVQGMMQHASGATGEMHSTNINDLVAEQLTLVSHGKQAQMPDLDIEITTNLDENAGRIDVIPQDIGRVLMNVLANAFDAVQERAKVEDPACKPRVSVSTNRVDNNVEIRVRDNGVGIPDNMVGKIFEPFFTTKPTGTATGLGLSLSHDIVVQGHGGSLVAESADGGGAMFVVTLPVEQVATTAG